MIAVLMEAEDWITLTRQTAFIYQLTVRVRSTSETPDFPVLLEHNVSRPILFSRRSSLLSGVIQMRIGGEHPRPPRSGLTSIIHQNPNTFSSPVSV